MATENRIKSFTEFWPFYLREHSHPRNRLLHWVGTTLVIICLLYAVANRYWAMVLVAPLFGYGFAWIGHFVVQRNRPATFKYPLWSLLGDFKLFGLMTTGQAKAEYEKYQIDSTR